MTSEWTLGNMFNIICISASLAQSTFVIVGVAGAIDDVDVICWRMVWGSIGRDVDGWEGEGARISRRRSSIAESSTVGDAAVVGVVSSRVSGMPGQRSKLS